MILHECPATYITEASSYFVNIFWDCHSQLPTGFGSGIIRHSLPRTGGLEDQDNLTIEAFNVIQSEVLVVLNQPPKKKPEEK